MPRGRSGRRSRELSCSLAGTCVAWGLCLVAFAPVLASQEPTLESVEGLPEGIPETIAQALDPKGYRVAVNPELTVELWLPAEIAEREPTGELGIEFGYLPVGAFVGVLRVEGTWVDYRKQNVASGTYTLRYGLQPADGDHTGQTWFRDFLMLVAVDQDGFPHPEADQEAITEASKLVTGTEHPAVAAIFQIYDAIDEEAIVFNDLSQPMLAVRRGDRWIGIIVEGYGQDLPL